MTWMEETGAPVIGAPLGDTRDRGVSAGRVPVEGARAVTAWDMVAVTTRRLASGERLDGTNGAIWALVLDGEARLDTATGVHELRTGDAFHVDGRGTYRLVAVTPIEVVVGTLRTAPPLPGPWVVRDFANSSRGVVELVRLCPLDPQQDQPSFAASYGGLIQAAMAQSLDATVRQGADPHLTTLVSALDAHPGRPWTVQSMARVAHLSRSSLGERFRRELGRSPAQVLREVRMRHARELLAGTDIPVERIALTVGYGSAAAFSRAFSGAHGASPQAWRSRAATAQHPEADAACQRGDGSDE